MRLSRPLTRLAALLALSAALVAGPGLRPAQTQTLDIGLGSQVQGAGSGSTTLTVEYQAVPSFHRGGWSGSWGFAGRVNNSGDGWLGIGFAVQRELGARWYFEASFMPGYYIEGETDLGSALEFRTLVGLGYRLSDRSSLIFAFDHLSNAHIGTINPGTNTASLRYRLAL